MKIAHYSWDARENGNPGGVEKFGWYFQKATGCTMYYQNGKIPPAWYIPDCLVVADGSYCQWFDSRQKMVSVVHGTWKELHQRCGMMDGPEEAIQKITWQNPAIKKVAVSQSATRQVYNFYQTEVDKVILHGVDLTLFKPHTRPLPKIPIVIHAATDFIKHACDMKDLAKQLKGKFDLQFLDAKIGEEPEKFARGDIFLHWSNYEGNSFAMIEALAAGLPIAGTAVGAFECSDIRVGAGKFCPWYCSKQDMVDALNYIADNYSTYKPRQVAEIYFSFERFQREWLEFLKQYE